VTAEDATDEDAIRAVLRDRREVLSGRLTALTAAPELGAAQGFGKRIGDGTTEAIKRLTDIGVGGSTEHALARIDRALDKLDEGTYGRCDACDKAIAPARLSAMPDSVLCVACAGLHRRPPPRR
jgi:DnaK suppressor protein